MTKGTVPFVTQHEPCRLSGHFVVAPAGLVDSALNARHRRAAPVDVAAFAVYNRPVIALHASKLAQSNDEAIVHGSFLRAKT